MRHLADVDVHLSDFGGLLTDEAALLADSNCVAGAARRAEGGLSERGHFVAKRHVIAQRHIAIPGDRAERLVQRLVETFQLADQKCAGGVDRLSVAGFCNNGQLAARMVLSGHQRKQIRTVENFIAGNHGFRWLLFGPRFLLRVRLIAGLQVEGEFGRARRVAGAVEVGIRDRDRR